MQRRPILLFLILFAVCLAGYVLAAKIKSGSSFVASASSSITQGARQIVDPEKGPVGECPLKHTDVKAEITGFLSRVIVTQEFENPFKDKIEAIYVFPL